MCNCCVKVELLVPLHFIHHPIRLSLYVCAKIGWIDDAVIHNVGGWIITWCMFYLQTYIELLPKLSSHLTISPHMVWFQINLTSYINSLYWFSPRLIYSMKTEDMAAWSPSYMFCWICFKSCSLLLILKGNINCELFVSCLFCFHHESNEVTCNFANYLLEFFTSVTCENRFEFV